MIRQQVLKSLNYFSSMHPYPQINTHFRTRNPHDKSAIADRRRDAATGTFRPETIPARGAGLPEDPARVIASRRVKLAEMWQGRLSGARMDVPGDIAKTSPHHNSSIPH